jgi:hypothetical protein
MDLTRGARRTFPNALRPDFAAVARVMETSVTRDTRGRRLSWHSFDVRQQLGKYDAEGLVFAKEALDAAGIEYEVRDDSPGSRYSPASGRMAELPSMYDLLVDADKLADAKLALDRWQEEAADAALRESGAPPPTAEDLAADAEWEKQKQGDVQKRSSPVWPGLIVVGAVVGLLAWLLTSH